MARFRDEIAEIAGRDAARDDVYQLRIDFFPVTTITNPKEEENG
jgi:hypothetical protein